MYLVIGMDVSVTFYDTHPFSFCKYQHKTALPQVPVVACIDDGTTT